MLTTSNRPDVTAIVLNWARLENVKVIVAHLCSEQLRDTIAHVIVWNNSRQILSPADFDAKCPEGVLKIVNSSDNLYFQARFLACADAPTQWCLVQDDDYLVSAEAIRALRKYTRAHNTEYPIHLLPPHEHLSTTIRTRISGDLVASFAWLGHGTLLTKEHARSFIDLLRLASSNQDDVMKMADNFFSILLNRRAEIWIDPGMHFETGVEQAFTVGVEGDARNWHYIGLAEEYLERAVHSPETPSANKFTFFGNTSASDEELVTRAPALASGRIGVWSTNIPMLPPNVLEAGVRANDLRSADITRRSAMGEVDAHRYVQYPFSSMGDGLSSTIFRSPSGCQEGQWVSFDFLEEQTLSTLTVEWTVEADFVREVQRVSYMVLGGDQTWVNAVVHGCEEAGDSSSINSNVTLLVHLGLGSPKTFTEIRAIVGPGSEERPPWGVVSCIIGGSRAK